LVLSLAFAACCSTLFLSSLPSGGLREAEAATPYSQVVDNSTGGRFSAPSSWKWGTVGTGYRGADYRHTSPKAVSQPARFKVKRPTTDRYAVYVRWPKRSGLSADVPIGVRVASGEIRWKRVNQTKNGGRWVRLGAYRLAAGDDGAILVSRWTSAEGRVAADAVRIVRESTATASPAAPEGGGGGAATTGSAVVAEASRHIGGDYEYGGTSPSTGFDCSGFTMYVYGKFGIDLPHNAAEQYKRGTAISAANVRAGDLVFGNTSGGTAINHVGIVTGDGYMIHAGTEQTGVQKVKFPASWYNVVGYRRLL
jgi:cell wall-associated NlpC family hydrolase